MPDIIEPIEVTEFSRRDAHRALDRWLDACGPAASDRFESGGGGYIGRIKLCAFVSDGGVSLRIERSFSEDLG